MFARDGGEGIPAESRGLEVVGWGGLAKGGQRAGAEGSRGGRRGRKSVQPPG